jgi:predicted nucleic acid-binding protein
MAAVARFLADASALSRLGHPDVAAVLGRRIEAGLVGMCGMVALELLYATRTVEDYNRTRANLHAGFDWLATDDEEWARAIDVQHELAKRGQLRAAKLPDLLIAATAERHRVPVIHYDRDFELISSVTGQPVEWVVVPGGIS